MNYAPKGQARDKRTRGRHNRTMPSSSLSSFGRRRSRSCGARATVVVRWTCRRRVAEASRGRVQGRLLNDDGDKVVVIVPRHISSVTVALFVTHHPRHHRPCRPRPLLHHHHRCLPATLVTIAIALATLFVAALIIGHALSLFAVTRCRARVHRPPSTVPMLVDCCLFTLMGIRSKTANQFDFNRL